MKNLKEIFIEEADKIIKKDGVAEVSVRKIGKSSGYSYATIYNYFKDTKELLAYCTLNVLIDCNKYMSENSKVTNNNIDNIVSFSESYFRYFIENPNYFQLVFTEDLGDYLVELMKEHKPPIIGNMLHNYLLGCLEDDLINSHDISILRGLISTAIHGRLLLVLRKKDHQRTDFHLYSLKKEINYILSKSLKNQN